MATASAPPNQRLRFEVNVPQLLTLDSAPEGIHSKGQYGDQYQYYFAGNQVAWLDPHVRDAIVSTGAQRGDELSICKREVKRGNRRGIEWHVDLIHDETQPPEAAPPPRPPGRAAGPQPVSAPRSYQPPASEPLPPHQPAPNMSDRWKAIEERMHYAIRIAERVTESSERRTGGDFGRADYSPSDVRALAISIFIESGERATRKGGA